MSAQCRSASSGLRCDTSSRVESHSHPQRVRVSPRIVGEGIERLRLQRLQRLVLFSDRTSGNWFVKSHRLTILHFSDFMQAKPYLSSIYSSTASRRNFRQPCNFQQLTTYFSTLKGGHCGQQFHVLQEDFHVAVGASVMEVRMWNTPASLLCKINCSHVW